MVWLFVLLIVAPLVELYAIIQVAQVIGGWETIALLVIESMIGAWLLKRQGLATLARISEATGAGRVPDKELVDGFLIMVAGALMVAPGFIGDVIAYLLLLPPTRAVVRVPLMRRLARRTSGLFSTMTSGPGARFVGTFRAGTIYDATGHDTAADNDGPGAGPRQIEP